MSGDQQLKQAKVNEKICKKIEDEYWDDISKNGEKKYRICKTCKGYGYYYHAYGSLETRAKRKDCTYCNKTGKVPYDDVVGGFLPRLSDVYDLDDSTCEAHPGVKWPHENCAGPGIPRRLSEQESKIRML